MRRLTTPLVLALVALAFVVLVGLGVWQLARDEQKQDLTRERDASIAAPPFAAGEAVTLPDEGVDYRRVTLDGSWDYERLQLIANRTRFGLRGEEVVVPLRPAGGGPAILVNRGWYPLAERDGVLAALAWEDGALEGLARVGAGVRAARTSDGTWTRFDVASIAGELPYELVPWRVTAGELIDRQPRRLPAELPVTGYEGFRNTTPHIEYALTWFGLAIVLVVTASVRFARRGRGGATMAPSPNVGGGEEGRVSDGHEAA